MCRSTKQLPPSIVTIGNFDGVHLGHQAILKTLVEEAKKSGLLSVVILFEPHPKEFFLKNLAPRRLQGLRDKITLIKKAGVERITCLRFSAKVAKLSPQAFIENILRKQLNAQMLVLGEDFRFGYKRAGDLHTLKAVGFKLIETPTLLHQDEKISSTWVREAVLTNDFNLAETLMGHPYTISGHVVHGNKHGRLLGYPTINMPQKANIAVHGVYAVRVELDGKIYEGVANVGHRPALNPVPYPLLEVYLFNYQDECYGKIARVTFISKIREEQMFENLDALKIQIGKDAQLAQKLLKKNQLEANMPKLNTVHDLVRHAIKQFKAHKVYYGHGTTNAEDEAWWLVLEFLKLPVTERETYSDKEVTKAQQKALLKLINRRAQEKIPVAYLLGEAYLGGLKFYVNEQVLIPRSPIAELIEQRFSPWLKDTETAMNILDLCTGSGCLAILCAHYFPKAQIDASDISEAALEVAQRNINRYHLEAQVKLIKSDVFDDLSQKQYHVIISNPPYVDKVDLTNMPEEYHHEPRLGLAAGEDGLDIVRRILAQAKTHLLPGGLLIVEIGNSQAALAAAYPNLPFTWLEFAYGGEGVFLLHKEDLA
jgi:ribosomal protein L3 glutamine methyltransferase